jgi:hypothetical protein
VFRHRPRSALALAVALAFAPLLASPAAQADDDSSASTLGGFSLVARANPLQFTYDSPGLLPVSPIVQVSVPESYSTLESGPTGYGLASLTFPGPLIADLASALKQQGPACQPPFALPTYPLRSEAFFPQGPVDADTSPVPGSRMHAQANDATSAAFSAWDDLGFPGVFSIGGLSGTSSTSGVGATAVTKAHSVVSGFSLLNGVLTIDSIVTDMTASSTGDAGKTSGTTRVSGAKVGPQKVTIDENGVTLQGKPTGGIKALLDQVGGNINKALEQSGISIRLFKQDERLDGGLAERTAGGLVIQLTYNGSTAPVFSTLLKAIPSSLLPADNATECAPSSPQGLFNLLKETHIESLALGGGTVSSNAAPSFDLPLLDTSELPGLPDVAAEVFDSGGGDLSTALGSSLDSGGGQLGNGALTGTSGDAVDVPGGLGIPAALILLALLAFPVAGSLSRRFADAALAAGTASGVACPLETQEDDNGG